MTSENEDFDNWMIALQITEHTKYPTENEDIDNDRRCVIAGVPSLQSHQNTESKPTTDKWGNSTGLTPWQRRNESWRLAPAWRPENASSLVHMNVQTKK